MKYSAGQKVRINRHIHELSMVRAAEGLDIPYVATISCIVPDFHNGGDMYQFEECGGGWYECEVEGLYVENIPIQNRFGILDLRGY